MKILATFLGIFVVLATLGSIPVVNSRATVSVQMFCGPFDGGSFRAIQITVVTSSQTITRTEIVLIPVPACPQGISTDPTNPTVGTMTTKCGTTSDTLTVVTSTNTYIWTVPASSVPSDLC